MPASTARPLSTLEKALDINLDSNRYGTFAEIGAGQEVVRWFFQAGGAAGTISKSISAYDMKVSDAIYGDCDRYVSRPRLEAMLEHEQRLNRERLEEERGDSTRFFSFADTVSARNYHGTNECHAWMGMRFQPEPGAEDDVIILHARMLDETNALQQEALGILGVNLVYGAFAYWQNPEQLIASLLDGLSATRIEIDMIDMHGPVFDDIDNRVLALRLVELGFTGAAMFQSDGTVVQPAEALRKRPLLVQRGRFRPVTLVNMDLLESARKAFGGQLNGQSGDVLPIMEMSLHSLAGEDEVCLDDFLSRAEVLATTGCTVMVSDLPEYYRLAAFLCRCTDRPIGMAMGLAALRELFNEKYYASLEGGLLEGFGRLFRNQVQLLVYPRKCPAAEDLETLEATRFDGALNHLFCYLREQGSIVPLTDVALEHLDIHSPDVLAHIAAGNDQWEAMVPRPVAEKIRKKRLFGFSDG